MNFRMIFSLSAKNTVGILIGIVLNPYIILGSIDILAELSLPVHEHEMSCHLYFHLPTFINVYNFQLQVFNLGTLLFSLLL